MSNSLIKIAICLGAAACVADNGSAKAFTVTANVLNAGAAITNPVAGMPTLNFPTFTPTNFPAAFSGLMPNQSLKLNNIFLTVAGSPSGSFSVQNSDSTSTVSVANNVYSLNLVANGAVSTSSAIL